jgi:rhodanese-like protein
MAKQRHQEPESGSSFNPIIVLAVGVVLVGGLVAWALTRTVEVAPTPPPVEQTQTADTQGFVPSETAAQNTPPLATATAGMGIEPLQPPKVEGDRHDVPRIAAEDLRSKMNRGEVTVIDVRDETSFEAGHITGALHMQFATIEGQIDLIPKGKPIVLYCT